MTIREGIKDLTDSLTEKQLVVLVAGLIFVICVAVSLGSALSGYRMRGLEKDVEAAKKDAVTAQGIATQKERQAQVYEQKIIFLEQSIADIQQVAKKQDEEVSKMDTAVGDARDAVVQSRRVKSITTTTSDLCTKLAALGHPC